MRVIDAERTGKNIRLMIKCKKLTVEELSKKLGVSSSSIYFWQRGEKLPSIDNLVVMSGILDCGLDDLLVTKEV